MKPYPIYFTPVRLFVFILLMIFLWIMLVPHTFAATQLPSGAAWSETQTLTVTNGIFRAELGSSTVIPTTLDFNQDNIYLDITFNSETFGSRVRMTAVLQQTHSRIKRPDRRV